MSKPFSEIKENFFIQASGIQKVSFLLSILSLNILIFTFIAGNFKLWFQYFSGGLFIFSSFVFLVSFIFYYISENKKEFLLTKANKTNDFQKEIKKIYEKRFKNKEYKDIFNEKIFVMIDLLKDLSSKNLKGVMQNRINETIHSSLKLYLINLESAEKMLEAQEKADLDFREEIKNLLEKNTLIIESLKEFITKLVLLNVSDKEFNYLVKDFENSLLNMQTIKKYREESL